MYSTLQEFIRFTKGWEYIIAIAAIFTFIVFWKLLSNPSPLKKEDSEKDDRV